MTISYTPTTWTSGSTAVAGATMNNIEGGVVACVNALNTGYLALAGGTLTGELDISRTLAGAQKIMEQFITSDGKSYQWIITTGGALQLYNITDSVVVASFGPTSAITASAFHGAADTLSGALGAYYDSTFHVSAFVGIDNPGTATSIMITSWDGTSSHNAFSVGSGGFNANCWVDDSGYVHSPVVTTGGILTLQCGNFIGFKQGNTRLAEMKNNGDFTIAGQNMKTTNSIYNYGTGGSFDSFDFAECYECDAIYPAGSVVCPSDDDDRLTLCTHDGCPFAMIVSAGGGFTIGGGEGDDEKPDEVLPIAVSGRVRVKTAAPVARKQWVTSDGRGGVRLAKPTERKAYRLGFALHETNAGEVGIFLRGK